MHMEEENKDLRDQTEPSGGADAIEPEPSKEREIQEEDVSPASADSEGAEKETPDEDETEEELPKLFTVSFNINADELYNFQLAMGGEQIEKNKKRSKVISVAEIVLGVMYFGAILLGKVPAGMFQYLLTVALVALGVYGLVYYKYFFYQSLRKSVNKQHGKVPYFNSEIQLDIYPNKCVEHFGEKKTENFWRNIYGVMSSQDAYYIQLDTKHCLLVPKRCAGEELGPYLRKMCEDFEKNWKES